VQFCAEQKTDICLMMENPAGDTSNPPDFFLTLFSSLLGKRRFSVH